MGERLLIVGWREVVKALSRAGFRMVSSRAHIYMVSILRHKALKKGALLAILAEAGLTKEEFH